MTDLAIVLEVRRTPEPIILSDYRRRAEVEHLIGRCRTMFGSPLGVTARNLLRDACARPDDLAWDEAHGVIVAPDVTLWEAVLTYTDYDVRTSPHFVAQRLPCGTIRTIRTEWSATPTSEQLLAALRALHAQAKRPS